MLENTVIEIEPSVVSTEIQENTDLEVTVSKREFSIVGDGAYITTTGDAAPQWLVDLIDIKIDNLITGKLSALDELNSNVQLVLAQLEVAKNDYTESINKLNTAEGNMLTYVETLNSTVGSSVAQAINLINTKASATEAQTIAVEQISASLNDGAIHSAITNVSIAVSDTRSAFNTSFDALETAFLDEDTGLVAKSEAMSGAMTSAGIDPETGAISTTGGIFNTLKSTLGDGSATALNDLKTFIGYSSTNATNHTGLTAYMTDSTGKLAGGTSEVANGVWYDGTTAKSKWEYNSDIVVGGQTYKSGFGLTTTAVGSEASSEFWINASKLKFTNTNKTGSKAPFSIDASGTVPEIYFNGKVTFSSTNINGLPTHTSGVISNRPAAPTVGSTYTDTGVTPNVVYTYTSSGWKTGITAADLSSTGTTVIDGGRIITGTIDANRINTNTLITKHIQANANGLILDSEVVGSSATPNIYGAYIKGSTIAGSTIDATSSVTAPLLYVNNIHIISATKTQCYCAVSHTITSGYFYGSSYSTGYLATRISSSSSYIAVQASSVGHVSISGGGSGSTSASLQYSIDGAATWINMDTATQYYEASSLTYTGRLVMFGIITGSIVPLEGSIQFRVLGGSSGQYMATLHNQ